MNPGDRRKLRDQRKEPLRVPVKGCIRDHVGARDQEDRERDPVLHPGDDHARRRFLQPLERLPVIGEGGVREVDGEQGRVLRPPQVLPDIEGVVLGRELPVDPPGIIAGQVLPERPDLRAFQRRERGTLPLAVPLPPGNRVLRRGQHHERGLQRPAGPEGERCRKERVGEGERDPTKRVLPGCQGGDRVVQPEVPGGCHLGRARYHRPVGREVGNQGRTPGRHRDPPFAHHRHRGPLPDHERGERPVDQKRARGRREPGKKKRSP